MTILSPATSATSDNLGKELKLLVERRIVPLVQQLQDGSLEIDMARGLLIRVIELYRRVNEGGRVLPVSETSHDMFESLTGVRYTSLFVLNQIRANPADPLVWVAAMRLIEDIIWTVKQGEVIEWRLPEEDRWAAFHPPVSIDTEANGGAFSILDPDRDWRRGVVGAFGNMAGRQVRALAGRISRSGRKAVDPAWDRLQHGLEEKGIFMPKKIVAGQKIGETVVSQHGNERVAQVKIATSDYQSGDLGGPGPDTKTVTQKQTKVNGEWVNSKYATKGAS